MSGFVLLKFASNLVLPPASMALGFLIGALVWLIGRRRAGLAIALLSALEMLVLSFPPVGDALIAPLQDEARREAALAKPCCYSAIVVLAGGRGPARVLHGAKLYRAGVASRIILTGGDLSSDPGVASEPDGDYMKRFLVSLGIPADALIAEDLARNTGENIANVRAIVGDEPVALVTSAYHMPRSLKLARRGDLKASAFPTDFMSTVADRPIWSNWLPTIDAMQVSATALWEYIGLVFDHRAVKRTGTGDAPAIPTLT